MSERNEGPETASSVNEFKELIAELETAGDNGIAEANLADFALCEKGLIIRALRYADAIENHPELAAACAEKISAVTFAVSKEHVAEIVDVVFAALREVVK